ncbi:MAG: D-alanyl-D-alanine carboxypeptidase/D-alanyl-D-alanine-endopeptidase [Paludibacter sp.]|nr:D-alanyl-D-alanine carboxypeptidase/D-alanyl-D-alanine-endopeptidase [Paludibacter sp.]MDD4197811.1 D-alanyl-D-alanine carboxypeptidase/D-alanyl-D-alanine-endopeptidase [Paludibacter sp.]MDD4427853.1 D-alanyl-D-alanine carboxypeptidase/D-alanyl-D-alanine-endopeptidase [Paludibacter sp.]
MKIKTLFPLLFIQIIFSSHLYAQNPVNNFINNPLLKNANISLLVKDLKTGKELHSYRANHATIPASTMKVVTTATALEIFGPDYRYETILAYDGRIDAAGVLNGNLYIVGCGDPTLGSSKMGDMNFLSKWVAATKAAGITKINGRIVADESRFDNEGVNSKWTWDDIGNYYAPGIYALAYLDNTLRVTFKSGATGTTPEIIDLSPSVEGLNIENNLLSSKITFDSAYFYGYPKSGNRSVRGEIPANRPGFVVKAELPDPGLTLARDFHQQLQQQHIEITSSPITFSSSAFSFPVNLSVRTPIYTHYSVPLNQIVKEINEKSNNFYAEQVFKSISLNRDAIATNKRSVEIVRNFWKTKGLDINQLFQLDGSGLSPANAVSASFLTAVMEYMYKESKHKEAFFGSLAIAGKTGTIAGVLKKTPLAGKIYAKSGTIERVRSYTGYILQDGREWVFTIIINNSNGNPWQTLSRIEDFLIDITKEYNTTKHY